jgi:hypothetical protein
MGRFKGRCMGIVRVDGRCKGRCVRVDVIVWVGVRVDVIVWVGVMVWVDEIVK